MEKRNYCVYRHTAPNGKAYVGITRIDPKKRWGNGNGYHKQSLFFNAIKKYGWDNFEHEILLDGLTAEEAGLAEKIFIYYWKLTDRKFGYNLDSGGFFGYEISDETRAKKSKAMKGRHVGGGVAGVNAGERNHNYGKHLSVETKKKLSESKRGEKAYWYGKRLSEEHKAKISKTKSKPVMRINKDTKDVVDIFLSAKEAEKKIGISASQIGACCRKEPHCLTAGGYLWEYI